VTPLSDHTIRPLILALAVATLPHVTGLRSWIVGWCLLLWGYAWIAPARKWPALPSAARLMLAMIGIGGIVYTAGYRFNSSSYVGLMMVMAALKPLEATSYRDKIIIVFLSYFIVIAKLFITESLSVTIYLFFSVWVTTAVLIQVHQASASPLSNLRLAGRLLAGALPLMMILFLLFPRVHGGLWKSGPARQGRTGFAESLRLDDISRLVQDNTVVFHAWFPEAIPEASRLYWRGSVFSDFDGSEWRRTTGIPRPLSTITGKRRITYDIALKPTGHRTLFALDIPALGPPGTRVSAGYTLTTRSPTVRPYRYRATSTLDYRADPGRIPDKRFTQTPATGNPQARQLANRWRQTAAGPAAIVDAALTFFRSSGFVYTLDVSHQQGNTIDGFLFETRKGYCEHYAASLAFLLRAAGIPCRLVGGYLGGERNPFGNYLTVRQSDAHVWTEVWLPGNGWTRVDPTAAVAPARITQGLSAVLGLMDASTGYDSTRFWGLGEWGRQLLYGWEALSFQWEIWFSGYSYGHQQALLNRLGLNINARGSGILFSVLFAGAALTGLFFGWWRATRATGPARDPARQLYDRFCKKMARVGIKRPPHQGPGSYARSGADKLPHLKNPILEITRMYVLLRYSRDAKPGDLERLKMLVQKFRPSQPPN
jgi:transglutaminase-like putative cysteine protease